MLDAVFVLAVTCAVQGPVAVVMLHMHACMFKQVMHGGQAASCINFLLHQMLCCYRKLSSAH
jgi:hypothetical protein